MILEIEHRKPIPLLANMVAVRAYTIDGVKNAEPFISPTSEEESLALQGFTLAEIALGNGEVHRS